MQSALPGEKVRNCDYAFVFEATSPKLTGAGPCNLYHRLGSQAGSENPYNYNFLILRIFAQFDITQSALPEKKECNCDYALIFKAITPKLIVACPWTLYHRLGLPAGRKNTYNYKFSILRVFDDYDF